MNNVKEMIEKIKAEIKRSEKEKAALPTWNKTELSRRVNARLVGKLNGLRFALDLLEGKKEVDPKTFTVPKNRGD